MPLDKHVVLLVMLLACAPQASKSDSAQTGPLLDSLVIERSECFGTCPSYRLRISSAEQIRFESRNRADSGNVVYDTAPPGTYEALLTRARAIGFYDLPPDITKDSVLCRLSATDHPTVVTSIHTKGTSKRVSDYLGCVETPARNLAAPIQKLRAFENGIDSALHSSRWTRPNSIR